MFFTLVQHGPFEKLYVRKDFFVLNLNRFWSLVDTRWAVSNLSSVFLSTLKKSPNILGRHYECKICFLNYGFTVLRFYTYMFFTYADYYNGTKLGSISDSHRLIWLYSIRKTDRTTMLSTISCEWRQKLLNSSLIYRPQLWVDGFC